MCSLPFCLWMWGPSHLVTTQLFSTFNAWLKWPEALLRCWSLLGDFRALMEANILSLLSPQVLLLMSANLKLRSKNRNHLSSPLCNFGGHCSFNPQLRRSLRCVWQAQEVFKLCLTSSILEVPKLLFWFLKASFSVLHLMLNSSDYNARFYILIFNDQLQCQVLIP